jgi:cytidylate kinase
MAAARNLDELVERQVRLWEAERRAQAPEPRGPCIALSRLPRAGAADLGRQIAELLDYGLFDIEIVDRIARELGVQRRLVAGLDEHVSSGIERYVADAFRRRRITETDYLRAVVRVVATLGERGRAVIIGRGSPYILPPARALRVLVVAPRETRIERLANEQGMAASAAEHQLAREDEERLQFLRQDFGVEPNDPTLYDLVVNTGTLSIEACAALTIDALRRRFPVHGAEKALS